MTAAGLSDVHTEPVTAAAWARVSESASIVSPPVAFSVTALGGSVSTPKGGVRAPVVRFDSLLALQNAADLAGKIAFVDVSIVRAKDGHGYGDGVPVRINGAIEASKKHAIAIVIRSVGTDHSRLPHTGVMRYEDGTAKIPAGALSTDDADLLTRTLARDPNALLRLDLQTKTLGLVATANVVGEVKGRGPGIVLLGGHLDSWDLGRGAVDDGAGIGIVLAAARGVLAQGTPKRTVRVVFFASEENSGAGSKAYFKAHESELDRHVAALESDHGAGMAYAVRFLGGPSATPSAKALLSGIPTIDWLDADASGGADIAPLRERGVPILDVLQDASEYFDVHHTAADVPEAADPKAMTHASCAVFEVASRLANSDLDLGRIEDGKRKQKW